jgi:hypothetical protein
MRSRLLRIGLLLGTMIVFLTQTAAQDKGKPKPPAAPPPGRGGDQDDYRRLFKRPTNTVEFWNAMQFEIEVGKYDLAAVHLRNLLNFKPSDADLVKIVDDVGITAFLRLRNIRRWSDDANVNKEVLANVEQLIQRVTEAVNKVRRDPERIKAYIKNLTASPEEYAYALKQLYKSGAYVVPYLIDALLRAEPGERIRLLEALRQLGPDTLEPMVAALDCNVPWLQVDLIRIFMQRFRASSAQRIQNEVVPNLWYLSAAPSQPVEVRRQAREALSFFLNIRPGSKRGEPTVEPRLPSATVELTRQAERYYLHRIRFANPKAVTVWRWDGRQVVAGWPGAATVNADKAEEYYGLRFAGQALVLDAAYTPAQVVLLSIVLDKTQSSAGLDKTLERAAPKVHDLLGTVQPALVNAVLERALKEKHSSVILGAVRDLGQRKEIRALRPLERVQPPLVRALYYPDSRVQMEAAEAVLQIPDSASSLATTRVVEILRRALAAVPEPRQRPKVLIGYFNEDVRNGVAATVTAAGYEPVAVGTGREMMQRLGQGSDIALLLFEEELPNPGLANLLGQLRADRFASQLPILLAASARREDAVRRYVAPWPNVTVIAAPAVLDVKALQPLIQSRLSDPASPALSAKELRDHAERSIKDLARLARGEVRGYDVTPAAPTVLEALRTPTRLTPEGQIAAMEVASRFKDVDAQTVLLNVLADAKRPNAVRIAAANALVRHVQQFSPLLTRPQVGAIAELYADPKLDEVLKTNVALVIGSLRPSARWSGQRLLEYQPPPPGAPPKK